MKTDLIHTLTDTFEAHAQQAENGIEFLLARDLQHLLGYDEWRNFTTVISKAKTSCEVSGHPVADHFVDVNKTITMPKGAEKEVPDLMLNEWKKRGLKEQREYSILTAEISRATFGMTPTVYKEFKSLDKAAALNA